MIRYLLIIALVTVATGSEARSLWSENSHFNYLLTDAHASRVGDILTIIVQEDNRAADSADSQGSRAHSMNSLLSMIWNNPVMGSLFGGPENAPGFSFNSSNSFNGASEVDRSNRFTTRISATVVKIDPVGNLLIEARKTMKIGEEVKTIVLSGKVRTRDIVRNTIVSSQIADAEISFLGEGTMSDYNSPRLLHRLFNLFF